VMGCGVVEQDSEDPKKRREKEGAEPCGGSHQEACKPPKVSHRDTEKCTFPIVRVPGYSFSLRSWRHTSRILLYG
jgi:hypothetical protein